ncbi:MAG: 2-C-methyl-D-erythritol 4-phosphate cytidylyltransferase [Ferruginibacter sp.]
MKKFAVIVAGGSGTRMNNPTPKQFLLLKGKPVLYYTIRAFLETYDDLKIILVLPENNVAAGQEIIDAFFDYKRIQITVGGRTRFHSVQNGLLLIDEESFVFVHDAVRCLVTKAIIKRCYESAVKTGSGIPVIACKDSVRLVTEEGNESVDRNNIRMVQTPQCFHSKILLPAFFNIDYKERYTDEATVVEAFGLKISLVEGDSKNIKITTTADIDIAEKIMEEKIT